MVQVLAWIAGDRAVPREMLVEHFTIEGDEAFLRDVRAAEDAGLIVSEGASVRLTERGWNFSVDDE